MGRKPIPKDIQDEVLARCRRRCAICFGLNRDTEIKTGQIAHLNQISSDSALNNLVFLCLDHHDQFDTRTSQSKGLTREKVRRFRTELTAAIEHAWREPVAFGRVQVRYPEGISGRWVCGDDFDSAEIEIEVLSGKRVRVQGLALHGKTWDIGPNLGQLDFEAEFVDQTISFVDKHPPLTDYSLYLRFHGDRIQADEEGAFGYFGMGAKFVGEYRRPAFSSEQDAMNAIVRQLNLATKADIEQLAVRNTAFVLGTPNAELDARPDHSHSFAQEEFIHPLIVRELLGWLADREPAVVAIDLAVANTSNQFDGEYSKNEQRGRTWLAWTGANGESFTYAHVGTSPSGIQIVECYDSGGGPGMFGSVGLFSIEHDRALDERCPPILTRSRTILKTLGVVPLGDRYCGTVVYRDGLLQIGPDEGVFRRGLESAKAFPIR